MARGIPCTVAASLLRKAGAQRVSDDAAKELGHVLEREALMLAKKAIMFSQHAGRKTILKDDVRRASHKEEYGKD